MYYAKQIDENGNIVALHSLSIPFPKEAKDFILITEDEYLVLLAEMEENQPDPEPTDEITANEALQIITGEVEA